MKCPSWRAPLAILSAVGLLLLMMATSLIALPPALLLLLIPSSKARHVFEVWVAQLQEAMLYAVELLLRAGLGIRISFHVHGGLETLRVLHETSASILIVANHRTVTCFFWIGMLVSAMRRCQGFRIVTMDALRQLPFAGWVFQCFGFIFIRRSLGSACGDASQHLGILRRAIASACGSPRPATILLFPEGRDLSERSIKASNAFADKHGLPRYEQVLHPKTAGFAEAWLALQDGSTAADPPWLLDLTLGYVDYVPGEMPNPISLFLLGRCPREIHITLEVVKGPGNRESAVEMCKELFARKETQLCAFYAAPSDPAAFNRAASGPPIIARISGRGAAQAMILTMMLLGSATALRWWLGMSAFCMFLGAEVLFFVVVTLAGGVDKALLRHAETWRKPDQHCNLRAPML